MAKKAVKKAAKKPTGAAAMKTIGDTPASNGAAPAAKPGLGKKFCPHCNATIAARSATCPECHKAIPPKTKKAAKKKAKGERTQFAARSVPSKSNGNGQLTLDSIKAAKTLLDNASLDDAIALLKALG